MRASALIRFIAFLIVLLQACSPKQERIPSLEDAVEAFELKYAEGFRITKVDESFLVEVVYPYQGATSGYTYLLVPKEADVPPHEPTTRVIRTPIETIVCTSTTHIPLLDYLNETDKLVGFPTTDYISSEKMRARIDAGSVQELGVDKGLNLEMLAVLKPSMVMGYTMTGEFGQYRKMEELGVPVVINAEYLEKHPLGRAEWIKFMAMFVGKQALADSVFSVIEREYLTTKQMADTVSYRPSVMSGIVYGDVWYLPGGKNYAATMLSHAGCNYLWSETTSNGFLELSFESVYDKANRADLWIGVGSYQSLSEINKADRRYGKFHAFQQGQVYTYNKRMGAKGGSEFLELGYLRPDIILKDLVKIAHPSLLPAYELFFYQPLPR